MIWMQSINMRKKSIKNKKSKPYCKSINNKHCMHGMYGMHEPNPPPYELYITLWYTSLLYTIDRLMVEKCYFFHQFNPQQSTTTTDLAATHNNIVISHLRFMKCRTLSIINHLEIPQPAPHNQTIWCWKYSTYQSTHLMLLGLHWKTFFFAFAGTNFYDLH